MPEVKKSTIRSPQGGAGDTRARVATAKWIAKGWEAAGVSVTCELCGGSDWALIGTDDAVQGLPVDFLKSMIQKFEKVLDTKVGKVKYCLFDMDGTLLNTEDIYQKAQIAVAEK